MIRSRQITTRGRGPQRNGSGPNQWSHITDPQIKRAVKVAKTKKGRAIEKVINEPLPKSWRDILMGSNIGHIRREIIGAMMPHILRATSDWAVALAKWQEPASKELSKAEQLKHFFATNPFGCRNKFMIEFTRLMLGCKLEDVQPPNQAQIEEDGGDGADEDTLKTPLSILVAANKGCAVKVVGGQERLRRELTGTPSNIFFIENLGEFYVKTIRQDGSLGGPDLRQLGRRISIMPEHYRPATETEIINDLLRAEYDSIRALAYRTLERKVINELFETPDRDEDTDDED